MLVLSQGWKQPPLNIGGTTSILWIWNLITCLPWDSDSGFDLANLPREFLEETKDRGMLVRVEEQVLVQLMDRFDDGNRVWICLVIGLPFAYQMMFFRYWWIDWGIGLEISEDVKREEVEVVVKEIMGRRNESYWGERLTSGKCWPKQLLMLGDHLITIC